MKLEHNSVVTSNGRKIITGTWRTDSGQVTSQSIKSIDLKGGKTDGDQCEWRQAVAIGVRLRRAEAPLREPAAWRTAASQSKRAGWHVWNRPHGGKCTIGLRHFRHGGSRAQDRNATHASVGRNHAVGWTNVGS